jgi:uncharacterized protein YjiS (DUF1127 family)
MSAINSTFHASTPDAPFDVRLRRAALAVVETIEWWTDRFHQRRALRDLPDYVLRDMALSRADVEAESGKPFWRP